MTTDSSSKITGRMLSPPVLSARSSRPDIPVLGRLPGSEVFSRLHENPVSETYPGLVIICFDGPLYFATADALRDKVRQVTTDATPPVTMMLIDMERVNHLDLEDCDMLNEIIKTMNSIGVEINLARVKQEVMKIINKDGVDQIIGRDHIHNKVFEAVRCFTQNKKKLLHGETKNG